MGVSCYWDVELIDAATGLVKQHVPWHKNCMLDAGLNLMVAGNWSWGQYSPEYIAVGSGNSTPVSTQTGLDVQIVRKVRRNDGEFYTSYVADANPITASMLRGTQFTTGEANGTIREMGIVTASTGGTFLNRDLLRDVDGNPIEIVKTSADLLNIKVKYVIGRMSETPFTTVLTDNKGTEYTVKGMVMNVGLKNFFSPYCWQEGGDSLYAGTNNTTDPAPADTTVKGTAIGAIFQSSPPAVPGTPHSGPIGGFYRDFTFTLPTNQANGDIGEIIFNHPTYGQKSTRVTFTPKLAKTTARQIAITLRYSIAGV